MKNLSTRGGTLRVRRLVLPAQLALSIMLAACVLRGANAEERPLWEAGFGTAPISFPAYRGSKDQQHFVLPLPYFIYRGDLLKVDRRGVRGLLFESDLLELNVSMRGSLPVDSDESAARNGMPDLKPTFQLGPSLVAQLAKDERGRKIRLKLPVRAVFATDFDDFRTAGFIFHPHLDFTAPKALAGWNLGFNIGPIFATQEHHAYYYDVAQRFVTPTRERFKASAGYSGTAAIAGVSRRFAKVWAGAFVRYDSLHGAQFSDSPLVERDYALSAGFAVAWIFAQSKTRVKVRDPQ